MPHLPCFLIHFSRFLWLLLCLSVAHLGKAQIPACSKALPNLPTTIRGQIAWASTQADAVSALCVPLVANLDPQRGPIPEIVVTSPLNALLEDELLFFAGDGSNAAQPYRLPVGGGGFMGNPTATVAIGDLNGDGTPEIVVPCLDNKLRVYTDFDPQRAPVMRLMAQADMPPGPNLAPKVFLADLDGEGPSEIVLGNQVYWWDDSGPGAPILRSMVPTTGAFSPDAWQSTFVADLLSIADCNGDPDCAGSEVVAGNTIYSVDISDSDGDPAEMVVRREVKNIPGGADYEDGRAVVADVDLDGVPDVVARGGLSSGGPNGVYVWNAQKFVGALLSPLFSNYTLGPIAVANVFDDTQQGAAQDFPEILLSTDKTLFALNLNAARQNPNAPYWWSVSISDKTNFHNPATTFDFNGDGLLELVYRDEDSLHVLYGGTMPFPVGVGPNRNWFVMPMRSGTGDEYPVIADVDNDGQAEIVCVGVDPPLSGNASRGRLKVIEADMSTSGPWMPTRAIWNQYNYAPHLVNEDLTLPACPPFSGQTMPVGSSDRPFNRVLGQAPIKATAQGGKLPLPDAQVTWTLEDCSADSVRMRLEVCNLGSTWLSAGLPLRFYAGNPLMTAANQVGTVVRTPKILLPDSCFSTILHFSKALSPSIAAVAGDAGRKPPPFQVVGDFPLWAQEECNYPNNIAVFTLPTPLPKPNLGADITACTATTWTFRAGPGFQQYRWSDTSSDSLLTVSQAGIYWVEAIDACGIAYRDTVVVRIDPGPSIRLGPDIQRCGSDSVLLTAPTDFSGYRWSPSTGLSCDTCANPIAQPLQTAVYVLSASNRLGCVSTDTIQIVVLPALETSETRHICAGDSVLVFGKYERTPGTFRQTFNSAGGCDSTHTFILEISPVLETNETQRICAGDSVLVFGKYERTPGTFRQTFNSTGGCDSTHTFILEISPALETNETKRICAGDSVLVFGQYERTPGTFRQTFNSTGGCDSTHTFILEISPVLETNEIRRICAGDSVLVFGKYERTPGTFRQTFNSAGGCDSTHTFMLEVSPVLETNETRRICAGDSVLIFGQYERTPGTFQQTFNSIGGCDSTHTFILEVSPVLETNETRRICAGDSVLIFGQYERTPGTFRQTFNSTGGCDSTHTLMLEVSPVLETNETRRICAGDSVLVFGKYERTPGTFRQTFNSTGGCDSTHTFVLEISPVLETTETQRICAGDSVLVFGQYEHTPGTFRQTFNSTGGCDSTHTFILEVSPVLETTETQRICAGDSVLVFGKYERTSGTFRQTFSSAGGCDSTHTYVLEVSPVLETNETQRICAGDSVLVFGKYERTAGVYSRIFTSINGCDSSHTISIVVREAPTLSTVIQPSCPEAVTGAVTIVPAGALPPYEINWQQQGLIGFALTGLANGTYSATVRDQNNCATPISIVVPNVAAPAITVTTTVPRCNGFADGLIVVQDSSGKRLLLSFNGGAFDTLRQFQNLRAGNYTLAIQDTMGCIHRQSLFLADPPLLEILLPNDTTIILGQTVRINPQLTGTDLSYRWSPATGLNCIDCPEVFARPLASTTYHLSVQNANGCTAADAIQIDVRQSDDYYVPNAFSPNDDRTNDYFTVYGAGKILEVTRLAVFDRWGGLLFERSNFAPDTDALGWDGSARGKTMGAGVYIYYLELLMLDGSTQNTSGSLTLIRG